MNFLPTYLIQFMPLAVALVAIGVPLLIQFKHLSRKNVLLLMWSFSFFTSNADNHNEINNVVYKDSLIEPTKEFLDKTQHCTNAICDTIDDYEWTEELLEECFDCLLRKKWDKSKSIDSVYIATDKCYPMPMTDFPEKVTQKQLDSWKKILLEIRHTSGFVIPTQFFKGDEEFQLWQADLANYMHYVTQTGDSIDYKLVRYYANACISFGNDDVDDEEERARRLNFKLEKAAHYLAGACFDVARISDSYACSYENSHVMFYHILQKCSFIDFYVSKYRDSIRGKTVLQKEYNALKRHLNEINEFEFSENYRPYADLREAFCYQINRYDYYENTLYALAYVYYILNDSYSFVTNKSYDRISTEEINAALDQLKNDLIKNSETVYTQITLKDDLRFIEMYKSGLNTWLKSREKALATLKGKEYAAFLKTDNAVRYFCMMHIKNAFRHYNDSLDDYPLGYVQSLYTFNSPADSVRYGRNWYQ